MTADFTPPRDPEAKLRERAVQQLRERRDFFIHLAVYAAVNVLLVVLWWWDDPGSFFWPLFPILGWGIGLFVHAWTTFRGDSFSEDRIRRQMDRMRGSV